MRMCVYYISTEGKRSKISGFRVPDRFSFFNERKGSEFRDCINIKCFAYQFRDERDGFPPGSNIRHAVDVAVKRIVSRVSKMYTYTYKYNKHTRIKCTSMYASFFSRSTTLCSF